MNEFRLIGEVNFVKTTHFTTGTSKVTFGLKAYITQKKFTFLSCESWNKAFVDGGLIDGMVIELTNYYPETKSWLDKMTGIKKTSQVVVVNNFAIIKQHQNAPVQDVFKEVATVPKQEFNSTVFEEPDWMKELDDESLPQPQQQEPQQAQTIKDMFVEHMIEPIEKPQEQTAKQAYENMVKKIEQEKEQQAPLPYTYEQLLEMNKPYQHGMIEKPTIVAKPDGTMIETNKDYFNGE